MQKRRFAAYILAGVLALGGAVAGAPYAKEYVDPAPATFDAVVKIGRLNGIGSGVSLPGGVVLTAAHVVKGVKTVSVTSAVDEKIYRGEVLWVSEEYDLALLKTDAKLPTARMTCAEAKVGDEVRAVGSPMGVEFVSSYGRIAGKPRLAGTVKAVYVTDLTIVMGNSGGPLFDADGNVIGISSMVMIAPLGDKAAPTPTLTGFSFVVPSSIACKLMGRVE